jgi:hypothetical protein
MTAHPGSAVRAVRWWLRGTGVLTLAAGIACILFAGGWLPGLIVGIGLVVYGIAALSTHVGPRAAHR